MHYSPAIACVLRLSVRLSVKLVDCDHTGWKSWKLIARTISPTPSLFGARRPSTYSQGNMGKFLGRLEAGWGKVACWSTKPPISPTRDVKIQEMLLWMNSPMHFWTAPSPNPDGLIFPKIGVLNPHPKHQGYLRNGFKHQGYLRNGLSRDSRNFSGHPYRAVIFAIAQLSCTS